MTIPVMRSVAALWFRPLWSSTPPVVPDQVMTMTVDTADRLRRAAGICLGAGIRVPDQTPHECRVLTRGCELLSYSGNGPTVLIVPAPIKRHYLWDLFPEASAVRRLLEQGFTVHMLRWTEAAVRIGAGLEFFAATAPGEALRHLSASGEVLLAGHSLGGQLAAMAACLYPEQLAGLLLVETPLAFGAHRLGRAAKAEPLISSLLDDRLTGAALNALSCALIPDEFLLRQWQDGTVTAFSPARRRLHYGVLRWALDEFPLPAPLVRQLLTAMAADAFLNGALTLKGRRIGPSDMRVPVLAVTVQSPITPMETITPFLERCTRTATRLLPFAAEPGTMFAHVSPLIGPQAQTRLWPEISAWMRQATKK